MKRTRALCIFGIFSLSVAACHTTYTGIYFIDRARYDTSTRFDDLDRQIDGVVKDFGLRRSRISTERVKAWDSRKGNVAAELSRLEGADAHISVAVGSKPLVITIRDFDNVDETEFIRVLKQRIEKLLEEHYGVRGLRFERQLDLFS